MYLYMNVLVVWPTLGLQARPLDLDENDWDAGEERCSKYLG